MFKTAPADRRGCFFADARPVLTLAAKKGVLAIQVYTVPEVAKILKISKNQVYTLIYEKRLKAIRLSKRGFRVSEEALHEFLKKEEWRAV